MSSMTLVIILENFWSGQTRVSCLFLVGFMLLLFDVVIKARLNLKSSRSSSSITTPLLQCDVTRNADAAPASSDPEIAPNKLVQADQQGEGASRRGEEHTLGRAVGCVDFWLLVVAMFCSMGSGTTAIDNMGQIGASLGYKQVEISTFVSLISIWNFLGRFGAGLVSELLLHVEGWLFSCYSRPCCLAFSLGLMCVGNVAMASAVTGCLYVGSVIRRVCMLKRRLACRSKQLAQIETLTMDE